jgi:hypothetical protein
MNIDNAGLTAEVQRQVMAGLAAQRCNDLSGFG